MVFYELGNGCDTCETVGGMIPNNVNMNMNNDSHSGMGTSMGMPYGTQNNVSAGSGYGTGGGMYGSGSPSMTQQPTQYQPTQYQHKQQQPTQSAMVLVPATTVSTTTTSNGQIIKQVTVPNTVAIPSPNSVPSLNTTTTKLEGFTDGTLSNQNNTLQHNSKMWVVLGLVIFSALAGNECCKYFLNKSMQLNDGSPLYYVAYIGVAILLTYATYTYSTKQ